MPRLPAVLVLLALAASCSPPVPQPRMVQDLSKPYLGGFSTTVWDSPDGVWEAAHHTLADYGINVSPLLGSRSLTDLDVLDAQVVIEISPGREGGTELSMMARASWTVSRELLESVFADLGDQGIAYEPLGYPASWGIAAPDPVLLELQRRAREAK